MTNTLSTFWNIAGRLLVSALLIVVFTVMALGPIATGYVLTGYLPVIAYVYMALIAFGGAFAVFLVWAD